MHINFFFRHRRPEYNSIEEVFGTVLQAFPKDITFDRMELPYTGAGLTAIVGNLKFARRHRGAINHVTGDVHYITLATGRNTVLTVHDASSALQGSFIRKLFIKILWFWIPALCVKKITAISPASATELGGIIPFAKGKIRVVPNPYNPGVSVGSRPSFARASAGKAVGSGHTFAEATAREARGKDGKFVVFLLGTKANKNLERTIEALDPLRVRLVILGKLTGEQKKLLDQNKFDYTSYFNIPYPKVAELYHHADLVCFASLYEGFGMPIIEAQLAGRPVVTSAIDPMKWVAGDGACLVDPLDVDSIRNGVNKVLSDGNYRQQIIERGKENVARFDPKVIAGMYGSVYEEVVGRSRQ